MIALFMAQRVILEKVEFAEMPEVLKSDVYDILKDSGLEYLAGDYKPE